METSPWFAAHWFNLLQTVGIVGGLLFTAYTTRKDERARRIANLISIKQQYREIWKELYDRPRLSRVLAVDADLKEQPVSNEELVFVKMLILHLDTVHRAMKGGFFIKISEIQSDIRDFMKLPIPKAVWEKIKSFQDEDFVAFVDGCMAPRG